MEPFKPMVERSPEDVLAGRLTITLAGQPYVLPVLTVGENADWLASLDAELDPLVVAEDDLTVITKILETVSDRLLDFIYSYDVHGLLPQRDEQLERDVYPHETLRGVMEIRLASNPTLGFALATTLAEARIEGEKAAAVLAKTKASLPSAPTSSRRRRTAGQRATSATN